MEQKLDCTAGLRMGKHQAQWDWGHPILGVVIQGPLYKPSQVSCCIEHLHLVRQCFGMTSAF